VVAVVVDNIMVQEVVLEVCNIMHLRLLVLLLDHIRSLLVVVAVEVILNLVAQGHILQETMVQQPQLVV
jgi:hypothetical protein